MSRFFEDKFTMHIPICNDCKHYRGGAKCAAFPERIPTEVFGGGNDHNKPLPNQNNDVVFESKKD
jgi:hypothetical protein